MGTLPGPDAPWYFRNHVLNELHVGERGVCTEIDTETSNCLLSAAAKCNSRINRSRPYLTRIDLLNCVNDLQ
jgi:hypothetical protein